MTVRIFENTMQDLLTLHGYNYNNYRNVVSRINSLIGGTLIVGDIYYVITKDKSVIHFVVTTQDNGAWEFAIKCVTGLSNAEIAYCFKNGYNPPVLTKLEEIGQANE